MKGTYLWEQNWKKSTQKLFCISLNFFCVKIEEPWFSSEKGNQNRSGSYRGKWKTILEAVSIGFIRRLILLFRALRGRTKCWCRVAYKHDNPPCLLIWLCSIVFLCGGLNLSTDGWDWFGSHLNVFIQIIISESDNCFCWFLWLRKFHFCLLETMGIR